MVSPLISHNFKCLLLGYPYFQSKRLIDLSQYWSSERLNQLQYKKLSCILKYALDKIPYYRDVVTLSPGLLENDLLNALNCFPLLDKHTINTNLKRLSHMTAIRGMQVTTGGSTGNPLLFYLDRFSSRQREKAFMFDQWSRVGYRFGDPIFNVRGRMPRAGQFIGHDRFFNIYYVSSIDLNHKNINKYISAMNMLEPKFLHGYPSTLYQLARLMEQTNIDLSFSFQAILCGSEKLYSYQRKTLESVFGCRIYSWYGHSEYLVLAGECEHSSNYHVFPQYGYTEFIPTGMNDDSGNVIYEIVATGFNNQVMPMIRYRTEDYAILENDRSCRCGRNYPLIKEIIGREQEFIVDNQESLISATSVFYGQHYDAFSGIDAFQIHQDQPGIISILVVKNANYLESQMKSMKSRLDEMLGERMKINYVFVEEIEKSPIGKARLVNQHLDIKKYLG